MAENMKFSNMGWVEKYAFLLGRQKHLEPMEVGCWGAGSSSY